jgi:hypothetical protein
MAIGLVTGIIDCGSIVRLFLTTDGRVVTADADGNLFRRAEFELCQSGSLPEGSLLGTAIEFDRSEWGGLVWFAPVEDGSAVQAIEESQPFGDLEVVF